MIKPQYIASTIVATDSTIAPSVIAASTSSDSVVRLDMMYDHTSAGLGRHPFRRTLSLQQLMQWALGSNGDPVRGTISLSQAVPTEFQKISRI